MELLQLRYFCDAAQTQNFSKTAAKYNVPPSNISQSIKRLEKELNVTLFNRQANKLTLNEQGKTFYNKTKQALDILENAKSEISDTEEKGTLKICIMTNRNKIMDTLEIFAKKYPQTIIMTAYNTSENNGEFDIIIADEHFDGENFEREMIVSEEISLAVNTKNPLSLKEKIVASDLVGENFITMDKDSSVYSFTKKICDTMGFQPNIVMQSPEPAFIRKCIELNLGITFVPTISWKGLFSGDVAIKKLDGFYRTTYAYKHKNKFFKKSVQNFIEMFKAELQKEA